MKKNTLSKSLPHKMDSCITNSEYINLPEDDTKS